MPVDDVPLAERFAAQLLTGAPARDVVSVAERLLAIQAQDPRGFRLAIRARSAGLRASDVDRALTEDRSVVVSWLNRGTLHLVRGEDFPWLHALTTPPLATGNRRRLAELGVTPDAARRGVDVILQALSADGPMVRGQVRERLVAAGVPSEGQALVHLLLAALLVEPVVRGPVIDGEQAYVLARDWLGPLPPVDRDVALGVLARRYLAGHGPASDRDLARWSGLPLRDARRGLSLLPDVDDAGGGLARVRSGQRSRSGKPRPLPGPRLLGAFDPVLLGWESRDAIVGTEVRRLVTVNGLFRPFALVRGTAVATWRLDRGRVALEPFGPVDAADLAALDADARDVERYLAR